MVLHSACLKQIYKNPGATRPQLFPLIASFLFSKSLIVLYSNQPQPMRKTSKNCGLHTRSGRVCLSVLPKNCWRMPMKQALMRSMLALVFNLPLHLQGLARHHSHCRRRTPPSSHFPTRKPSTIGTTTRTPQSSVARGRYPGNDFFLSTTRSTIGETTRNISNALCTPPAVLARPASRFS